MTWVAVGVAAAGVVSSAYSANKGRQDANAANRASREGLESGVYRAEELLSPYIASSESASRQLMIELGMGENLRERDITSISDLETRLEELRGTPQPSAEGGAPGGVVGGLVGGLVSGMQNDLNTREIAYLEGQLEKERAAFAASGDYETSDAYMQTAGYQASVDAGTKAVDSAAANAGALYSGSRGEALKNVGQGVQQSYYQNYMNMLQNLSNPAAATNLANINIGVQGSIGQQNIAATTLANQNRSDMTADIFGGVTSALTAYMDRPKSKTQPQGVPLNQTDYSSYV